MAFFLDLDFEMLRGDFCQDLDLSTVCDLEQPADNAIHDLEHSFLIDVDVFWQVGHAVVEINDRYVPVNLVSNLERVRL